MQIGLSIGLSRATAAAAEGEGEEAPVNSVLPVISGSGETDSEHTVTTGTWSGDPDSYAYQWLLDDVEVGTDANAYTPTEEGELSCEVTATNGAGTGTPAVAEAVTITDAGEALAAPVSVFTAVIDSTTATTVRESGAFTPNAARPLLVVVQTQNDATGTAQTLRCTIGAAARGAGTGTALTLVRQEFTTRSNVAIFKLDAPTAASTTVQVDFTDGITPTTPRAVIVTGWQVPGGSTSDVEGVVSTTGGSLGNNTSFNAAVVSGTNNSLILYAGVVSMLASPPVVVIAGATELYNQQTGAGAATDCIGTVAWEAAATAGSFAASHSWTGSAACAWVAMEVLAA
jgi:hypothetical protein